MASLFFNAAGTLYGYGTPPGESGQSGNDRNQARGAKIKTLYKINIESGDVTFISGGPEAESNDGCACPYNIEFHKSVSPSTVLSCSEVRYTFTFIIQHLRHRWTFHSKTKYQMD